MKTTDRIRKIINRYREDPDVESLDAMLCDIERVLDGSVVLVQDLGSSGLHAEVHESRRSAVASLGRYVKREWLGRGGPGYKIIKPKSHTQAIEVYYSPDLGGRENYEQYDILPL